MKNRIRQAARAGLVAASMTAASVPALAHHSFSPFDMGTQKTVTGTVKAVEWTNPHTWIWLDVANEQGAVDAWGFEGMSPNFLARRGWTRTSLKVGDRITVTFRPLRDGKKGGMFVSTKAPDGKMLTMQGGTEPEK